MDQLQDTSAERGILSSLCKFGKDAYLDVIDIIQPSHFTLHTNQALASVLYSIFDKDIEAKIDLNKISSVASELGLAGQITDKENFQYVNRILTFNVELSNTREFAKKVRRLAESRYLIGLLGDTAESLKKITGAETLPEIVAKVEGPIFDYTSSLTGKEQQTKHISDGLDEYLDITIRDKKEKGKISIGYPIYEQTIGFLNPGVHLLTGRPKIFKSTHAMNSALYCAGKTNNPCLLVDSEMSLNNGQWARAIARMTGVPFNNIFWGNLDDSQERKINKARKILKSIPLYYCNVSGKEFGEIISSIRRWLIQIVKQNDKGLINNCLVIYDYLKLNSSSVLKQATEWQELGFRISSLHELTVKYNVPIILYSQLSREMDIAASDRARWFSSSICSMQKKSEEEIAEEGGDAGNRKLIVEDCRFGSGLEMGDYINYNMIGNINTLIELNTRNRQMN